jgi:hypothetical protein
MKHTQGTENRKNKVTKFPCPLRVSPITHKKQVSGCGFGTPRPCADPSELDRGNPASVVFTSPTRHTEIFAPSVEAFFRDTAGSGSPVVFLRVAGFF